jgi:hypothetical protein
MRRARELLNTVIIPEVKSIIPVVPRSIVHLVFMVIFTLFVVVFMAIMANDKQAMGKSFLNYIISFVIIILTGCSLMFLELKSRNVYWVMGILVVSVSLILFNKQLFGANSATKVRSFFFTDYPIYPGFSKEVSFLIAYSLKMLVVCAVIIGASIFYRIFLNNSYKQKGYIGFIIQFLFYIPCLVSDYFAYLLKELQMTPFVVYYLLGIEVVLIGLYFLIPYLFRKMSTANSYQVLKSPLFLNHRKPLDGCKYIMKHFVHNSNKTLIGKTEIPTKNRQTAFSMWISVNATTQLLENEKHTIFQYSSEENTQTGKPGVYYTSNNEYLFVFSDASGATSFTTAMPVQKWNHVVFNYFSNRCDLFLNGKLATSVTLDALSAPTFHDADSMIVGEDKDSIVGAICNINAYRLPMTPEQIAFAYNMYHLRNPPV